MRLLFNVTTSITQHPATPGQEAEGSSIPSGLRGGRVWFGVLY